MVLLTFYKKQLTSIRTLWYLHSIIENSNKTIYENL